MRGGRYAGAVQVSLNNPPLRSLRMERLLTRDCAKYVRDEQFIRCFPGEARTHPRSSSALLTLRTACFRRNTKRCALRAALAKPGERPELTRCRASSHIGLRAIYLGLARYTYVRLYGQAVQEQY